MADKLTNENFKKAKEWISKCVQAWKNWWDEHYDDDTNYQDAFLAGANWQKQLYEQQAIEAEVGIRILPTGGGFISYNTNKLSTTCEEGYKVKLIILQP